MDGESKSGLDGQTVGRMMALNLPAHEVDTSIDADKCGSAHVADHAIVLNWQVASRLSSVVRRGSWGSHSVHSWEG